MKWIQRELQSVLLKASRSFAAVILTGPRRSGKTTLLRQLFPLADYRLLEDPDQVARFRADPRSFLDELKPPVILDEIQNVPELLNYLRARIDRLPKKTGQWFLTGSQEAPLMRGVTESMAGRAAVLQLLPLSLQETEKVSLFRGGFPEIIARPSAATLWFSSYVQTYLERDVRSVSSIRDLSTFRRFLALVASRTGQMQNKTDLAAPLGMSVPAIGQWLSILEITGQILLVPPFYENFGKRLIKSPKIYFLDSGLACHLLGIDSPGQLNRSPFLGPVFEGFVAAEIVKRQISQGKRKEIYYFRDQQGLEVDFIVPRKNQKLSLIEVKATRTIRPESARSISLLKKAIGAKGSGVVVYQGEGGESASQSLHPDAKAITLNELDTVL